RIAGRVAGNGGQRELDPSRPCVRARSLRSEGRRGRNDIPPRAPSQKQLYVPARSGTSLPSARGGTARRAAARLHAFAGEQRRRGRERGTAGQAPIRCRSLL